MVLSFGVIGNNPDAGEGKRAQRFYYPATSMKWSVLVAGDSKLPWTDNDEADGNTRDGVTQGDWYLHLNFPAGTKLVSCTMYAVISAGAPQFYLVRHTVASDGGQGVLLTGNCNVLLRVDGVMEEGYCYLMRMNASAGNNVRMKGAMVEVELP